MIVKVFNSLLFLLFVCVAASRPAVAQSEKFAEYRVQISIDSAKGAHYETFRLPAAETDSFLSLYKSVSVALGSCAAFEGAAKNPLNRRLLGFKVSPSPGGCNLQIREYGVWLHDCNLSQSEQQSLAAMWMEKSSGSGLGAWGPDEYSIFKSSCESEQAN